MSNTFLQVRVDEKDKEQAAQILDGLGTNLSTVVNMLIKQIIITESIPFDIKLGRNAGRTFSSAPQAQAHAMIDENQTTGRHSDPVLEGIREEYEW